LRFGGKSLRNWSCQVKGTFFVTKGPHTKAESRGKEFMLKQAGDLAHAGLFSRSGHAGPFENPPGVSRHRGMAGESRCP